MPLTLIAEVGTTCNGKLDDALRLADAVKASGADWIKYMLIGADHFMADKTVEYTYQWAGGEKTVNMYEMFKGLEFTGEEWSGITAHCQAIGLPWYLTVDYLEGVDLAEDLGCPIYKLSAWDIRNFPLIRRMAQTGKPIQVDLGPSLFGEVVTLVDEFRQISPAKMSFLHSTHGDEADSNLYSLHFLDHLRKQLSGTQIGWSSPGRDFYIDGLAVAAGAELVEKRLTLDGKVDGHHNLLALEPDRFKKWVAHIRRTEELMGKATLRPSLADLRGKDKYFTSIVANRDIRQGENIGEKDLAAKRPGMGISPLYIYCFTGKKAMRDIPENSYIRWEDVP